MSARARVFSVCLMCAFCTYLPVLSAQLPVVKEYVCQDPDTGVLHPINTTWRATTFCGNYSCKLRAVKVPKSQERLPQTENKNKANQTKALSDNDRLLTKAEINKITELLSTVKKSDLQAVIELYNIAQEIYKDLSNDTQDNSLASEEKLETSEEIVKDTISYWYDPLQEIKKLGDMKADGTNFKETAYPGDNGVAPFFYTQVTARPPTNFAGQLIDQGSNRPQVHQQALPPYYAQRILYDVPGSKTRIPCNPCPKHPHHVPNYLQRAAEGSKLGPQIDNNTVKSYSAKDYLQSYPWSYYDYYRNTYHVREALPQAYQTVQQPYETASQPQPIILQPQIGSQPYQAVSEHQQVLQQPHQTGPHIYQAGSHPHEIIPPQLIVPQAQQIIQHPQQIVQPQLIVPQAHQIIQQPQQIVQPQLIASQAHQIIQQPQQIVPQPNPIVAHANQIVPQAHQVLAQARQIEQQVRQIPPQSQQTGFQQNLIIPHIQRNSVSVNYQAGTEKATEEKEISNNVVNTENKEEDKSWKTESLSENVINDIRANVAQRTKLLNIPMKKRIKLERLSRVFKLDPHNRNKRSIMHDVDNFFQESDSKQYNKSDVHAPENYEMLETYIEKVTCEPTTELGYFKMGNMTKPFPHCCPQKIENTQR